ncbi:MAG: hypothetical protein KGZ42_08930 [Melioribacter sp.]|nr:hypothetical protein [Melioribacter sp.]
MNRLIISLLALILIFSCSSQDENKKTPSHIRINNITNDTIPRVTGIGGIFFKSKDPSVIKEWYGKNLGLSTDLYGSVFEFRNANDPDQINYLRWSPFETKTDYFSPSVKEFMINYRVQNIEGLIRNLKSNGVKVIGEIQKYEYGKFAYLIDPDGNKIELWEPVDSVLTKMGGLTTK